MPDISIEKIRVALRNIVDPITGRDLVTAKRIGNIHLHESRINCTLVFQQALSEQQKTSLNFHCMEVLQRRFPNHQAHIHLETQLRQDSAANKVLPQVVNILAVASGKGGVGKSTVSTNLALALKKQGHAVGLMDADLYGPSIPTMLGLSGQRPKLKEVHGKPKIVPLEVYDMPVISIGFIVEPEQAVVLRGPRLAGIIKQFIEDCLWPDLDYLIVDLPPGTGDIQLTMVQSVPVTGVIMVTTPQQVSVIDAIKAANMFQLDSINVPLIGVIENMSWFSPPETPEKRYYIFGQGGGQRLADLNDSILLGQLPIVETIREGSDQGVPSVINDLNADLQKKWSEIAERVSEQVKIRNEKKAPTQIVDIKT